MRLHDAQLLVRKFCIIAKFSTDNLLFNLSTPMPEILSHDFIEMYGKQLSLTFYVCLSFLFSLTFFISCLLSLSLSLQSTTSSYFPFTFYRFSPPPSLRHAQVLGSIQAFTHWLSELYLASQRTSSQYTDTLMWFTSVIVDSTHPLITRDIPEKVVLSACQLLLSLATTVRPKFALSLPGVKELTKKAKDGELGDIPHRVG